MICWCLHLLRFPSCVLVQTQAVTLAESVIALPIYLFFNLPITFLGDPLDVHFFLFAFLVFLVPWCSTRSGAVGLYACQKKRLKNTNGKTVGSFGWTVARWWPRLQGWGHAGHPSGHGEHGEPLWEPHHPAYRRVFFQHPGLCSQSCGQSPGRCWSLLSREGGARTGTLHSMFSICYENHTLLKYQENILKKVPIKWIFLLRFIGTGGAELTLEPSTIVQRESKPRKFEKMETFNPPH